MNLKEITKKISNNVVAVALQVFHPNDETIGVRFNPSTGTGFIIDEDGLILTCGHVVDEIIKAQDPKLLEEIEDIKGHKKTEETFNFDSKCPAYVIFFIDDGGSVMVIPISIISLHKMIGIKTSWKRLNDEIPDIGILEINAKGFDKFEIIDDYSNIFIGEDVATIGFPMGNDLLFGFQKDDTKTNEYLKKASPVLQKGIISAILPVRCNKPESILTNIMIQGGASGSPLFLIESGKAVGMLYGSLYQNEPRITTEHSLPTSFSYAVPLHFIKKNIINYKNEIRKEKRDIKDIIKEYKDNNEIPTYTIGRR